MGVKHELSPPAIEHRRVFTTLCRDDGVSRQRARYQWRQHTKRKHLSEQQGQVSLADPTLRDHFHEATVQLRLRQKAAKGDT